MNRTFKSLSFLAVVLFCLTITNVQAQEYALDFSKTQTFRSSCAGIASDRLTVSRDSCEITTHSLKINDASPDHQKVVLVSVKINKEGKLGKSDKAWVKLFVNGLVSKSYSIKGDGVLENYKRQDKIILSEPSDVAVQVLLKSVSRDHSWVIKSGDIGISTTDYSAPREVNAFNGSYTGKVVKLNWATPSESNNNYFTVERSRDGINFEKAALVKGAGNSEDKNNYGFVDHNLYPGNTYYRLKQISFSGKEKQIGEVISVATTAAEPSADFKRDNVSINSVK